VRAILIRHGLPPAPQRAELSRRNFLRRQAATTVACDFFTVETAWLQRIYVLFFVSLQSRRVEFVACTASPTGAGTAGEAACDKLGARRPERVVNDASKPKAPASCTTSQVRQPTIGSL
jgi:hypothetical protein